MDPPSKLLQQALGQGGWTVAEIKHFPFRGEFNRTPQGSGDIGFLTALDIKRDGDG